MTDQRRTNSSVFDRLLADYIELIEAGDSARASELLGRHPDLADSIRGFVLADQRLRNFADAPVVKGSGIDEPTMDSVAAGVNNISLNQARIGYFGDYELLEEIARGGMGVVYKARQVNLNRIVALKMILAGQLARDEDVKRFYAEAQAAGKLDHPGIVPIFEVGQWHEQHYFSMAYVEGESLAERIVAGPLPQREAALVTKIISDAIAYAHHRGVIHRDLKPANVLLAEESQPCSSNSSNFTTLGYTPKVTDFGLAKRMDDDSGMTASGQILGTPAYMPPEQASGRTEEVTETADVYSLGAMLYCMLVGRPPFQAASPVDTLLQVLKQEPVPPRQINPAVPRDLETICLKCLQKDRRKRYPTAQELADELQRFLSGEPILARPVSSVEKAWRWCRRNPIVASVSAAAVLLLVLGTIVSSLFAVEASRQAKIATAQKEIAEQKNQEALAAKVVAELKTGEAETARKETETALIHVQESEAEARWNLYVARLHPMGAAWVNEEFGELEHLLNASTPSADEPDFRGWEWYFLQDQLNQTRRSLTGNIRSNTAVDWGRKKGRLAVVTRQNEIAIRGRSGRAVEKILPVSEGLIHELAWSPNEKLLAVAHGTTVSIWEAETGQREAFWKTGFSVRSRSLAWSPDGRKLAACAIDQEHDSIKIWESKSGQLIRGLVSSKLPQDVAWHPDNLRLASADRRGQFNVWDTQTAEKLASGYGGDWSPLASVAWSPDGKKLATGGAGGLRIWDEQGQEIDRVLCNLYAGDVTWSSDGKFLAASGTGQEVILWKSTAEPARKISIYGEPVWRLCWSPDSQEILVAGEEIRILSTATRMQSALRVPVGKFTASSKARWSPDGKLICCIFVLGTAFCDPQTGTVLQTFPQVNVTSCAWSPDSKRACSLSYDRVLQVWNTENPAHVKLARSVDLGKDRYENTDIVWSVDGKWVFIGSINSPVAVWNAETWEKAYQWERSHLERLAVSPDGYHLLGGSGQSKPYIWNVALRTEENAINVGSVQSLAWNPTASLIAIGGRDGKLSLVHPADGKLIRQLAAHRGPVHEIAFSPDNKRLATGGADGSLTLWDAATAQKLFSIPCLAQVYDVAWSPDGDRLSALCEDGTLRIFSAGSQYGLPVARIASDSDAEDRRAAEWILKVGGTCNVLYGTEIQTLRSLKQLPDLPFQLQQIQLNDVSSITNDDLATLQGLKGIRHLSLLKTPISDDGLKHLSELHSLTHLNLGGTQISGEGLRWLKELDELQSIMLNWMAPLTDEGISNLPAWPKLTDLAIDLRAPATDAAMRHFQRLPALQTLGIFGSDLTGEGLKYLKEIPTLSNLVLASDRLESQKLAHLQACPQIKFLTLRLPSELDNEAVEQLSKLKHLEKLDLSKTAVSSVALSHLQDALPTCEIAWNATVSKPVASEREPKRIPFTPRQREAFIEICEQFVQESGDEFVISQELAIKYADRLREALELPAEATFLWILKFTDLYTVTKIPAVREWMYELLDMTPEQRSQHARLGFAINLRIQVAAFNQQIDKINEIFDRFQKEEHKLLSAQQRQRLGQLALQQAVWYYGPGALLQDLPALQPLKLTDPRRKQIKIFADRLRSEISGKVTNMDDLMQKREAGLQSALMLLNESQRELWPTLIGEPIDYRVRFETATIDIPHTEVVP